jgi:DNA repair exonuclease SbcCD ATPase subunit
MSREEDLFADILNNQATPDTLFSLAQAVEEELSAVFAAFNDLSMQSCMRVLEAFHEQPFLGQPLLETWLRHADLIESRNLQRFLCEMIGSVATQQVEDWKHQNQQVSARLAEAAENIARLKQETQHYADVQQRYSAIQEELAVVEKHEQDIREMQSAIQKLGQVDQQQLAQELSTLREQRQQLAETIEHTRGEIQSVEEQIQEQSNEHQQLEDELATIRRQYDQKKSQSEDQIRAAIKPLRERLKALEQLAARLSNPPLALQSEPPPEPYRTLLAEIEELKRLILDGELRNRVEQVYRQWNDVNNLPVE